MALQAPYRGDTVQLNQVGNFIPELWANDVLKKREPKLQATMAVTRQQFAGGKKGDIIHYPIIYEMAVNDKLPATMVNLQTQTPGDFTVTIDKYKESSFMIEDVVGVQSKYNVMSLYTERASRAMANDIDNAILGMRAAVPTSQWIYVSSDGAESGTPQAIDEASILAAMQLLDEQDVPEEGRMILVSPGQYADLLAIDKFIDRDFIDGYPVSSGALGSLYGMQVYKVNKLKTNSLTGYRNGKDAPLQPTPGVIGSPYLPSQDSFNTLPYNGKSWVSAMVVHPSWCFLMDAQTIKVETSREVLYQADALVMTQIYGTKMSFYPEGAILIHSRP